MTCHLMEVESRNDVVLWFSLNFCSRLSYTVHCSPCFLFAMWDWAFFTATGSNLHKQGGWSPRDNDQWAAQSLYFFCLLDKKKTTLRWRNFLLRGKTTRDCATRFHAERCWWYRRCCGELRWTFPHCLPVQVSELLLEKREQTDGGCARWCRSAHSFRSCRTTCSGVCAVNN